MHFIASNYERAHNLLHRTTDPLHSRLMKQNSHYARWHHHPRHRAVHFGVLFLVALALVAILIPAWKPGQAASRNYTISTKQDWDNGTIANLETDDIQGDIKISAPGTWTARTLKTPPYSVTAGIALAQIGTDTYVMRGNGDNKFWKYASTTDSWTELAVTPYGVYSGSDLVAVGSDTLYAVFGGAIDKFYKYTISTNTWEESPHAPDVI
jgi:hypothetical protein